MHAGAKRGISLLRKQISKWNKSNGEKQIPYNLSYKRDYVKSKIQNKTKLIDTQNELVVVRVGEGNGWAVLVFLFF